MMTLLAPIANQTLLFNDWVPRTFSQSPIQIAVRTDQHTDIYMPPKAVRPGVEPASSWPILLGLVASGVLLRLWTKNPRREDPLDRRILGILNREGELTGVDLAKHCENNGRWGTLYPALMRLRSKGLIEGNWHKPPVESQDFSGRERRYWRITDRGRKYAETA